MDQTFLFLYKQNITQVLYERKTLWTNKTFDFGVLDVIVLLSLYFDFSMF